MFLLPDRGRSDDEPQRGRLHEPTDGSCTRGKRPSSSGAAKATALTSRRRWRRASW